MKSRNGSGLWVGAPHPRSPRHAKPLSPSLPTLNPDSVNILMAARDEAGSGPALRASAISASRGIMNSVSAGYFFSILSGGCAWVWAAAAEAPASSKTSETASLLLAPPRRAWVEQIRMAVFSLYCSRRRLGETHREARWLSGNQTLKGRTNG